MTFTFTSWADLFYNILDALIIIVPSVAVGIAIGKAGSWYKFVKKYWD